MDDISAKLNEILSNPQSMQQIQSMMSSLGGSESTATQTPQPAQVAQQAQGGGLPDMSMLSSLLGSMGSQQGAVSTQTEEVADSGFDAAQMMSAVSKMAPLMGKMKEEDDSTRLLRSLRPLLSNERQQKLDESLKIMQLMRLMPMMKNSGFLSGLL